LSNYKGGQETKKGKVGQEKGTIKEVKGPKKKGLKVSGLMAKCKKHSCVDQTIQLIHPHQAMITKLSNHA
jgi:hypothetical protein